MAEIIIVAIVSGIFSSVVTYSLCIQKEKLDYQQFQEDMQIAREASIKAVAEAELNGACVASWNDKIVVNRKDLDALAREFYELKKWVYGYVSYLPKMSRDE